jgi:hypothetical protein
VRQQFRVAELVLAGGRGRIESKNKQALHNDGLRYISALTDPWIRKLLSVGKLQMGLFSEQVVEVEDGELPYVFRKNGDEAARVNHRLGGELARLKQKIERRNEQVAASSRLDGRELRFKIDEVARSSPAVRRLLCHCYRRGEVGHGNPGTCTTSICGYRKWSANFAP